MPPSSPSQRRPRSDGSATGRTSASGCRRSSAGGRAGWSGRSPGKLRSVLRIEFHRADAPDDVVGAATWDGRRLELHADDPGVRSALERIFRPTPVVVDDPALRGMGTSGEVVLQPGSVEWFERAAFVRASEVGLVARVVRPGVEGGWDPAAAYRRFREQVRRLTLGPPAA